ncbi:MAG: XRE family transcriptional regulator [Hyphomicrobiaceae bacterium]
MTRAPKRISDARKRPAQSRKLRAISAGKAAQPTRAGARQADGHGFLVAARYLTDGLVDADKIVAELGMTKAALAQSLGFAEETLQRFSRVTAPKTQHRLREMIEILTRVAPWAGGMPQALGWYRGQSIPALGDQTAEALVKTDQAGLVRSYLDGVAAGGYA